MSNLVVALLLLALSAIVIAVQNELVQTRNGFVRGKSNKKFMSWEGIPYAQPPIGKNRFEPPIPVKNWIGVKNATVVGNTCLQWNHFIFEGNRVHGNEDCLYLNIYRSKKSSKLKKLPVIFFIHGGAFAYGSGDFYGPKILMKIPVIYVSINYRLGPLGFLSTENKYIPGNMGLKDQSLALKWIKQNIETFGGDSKNIILTGFSAGAASVHLHYLSKLSRGLFRKGISHSGTALNPWVFMEKPLEKTKLLALNVGCPIHNTKIITECLKQKSAEDITASIGIFQPWLYNPISPFGAVIEPIESDTAFITAAPEKIIRSGNFYQVPWLVSTTQDEGWYPAGEFLQKPNYLIDLNANWTKIAPFILHMNDTIPYELQTLAMNKIRREYFGDLEITEETFPSLVEMLTDHLFLVGIQRSIKLHLQYSKAPVYFDFFRYDSSFGLDNALALRTDIQGGVAHGDDVFLIYDSVIRGQNNPYTDEELKVQKELLHLYYSFATDGCLTLGGVKFLDAKIKENHDNCSQKFQYLDFVNYNDASMVVDDDIGNEKFWKKFPYN